LQRLQQIIDVLRAGQDGGDDDHAAALRRNATGRIPEPRQQLRLEQERGEPVPQRHRQLTDTEQKCERAKCELPSCASARLRRAHKSERGQEREQRNSAYIKGEGKALNAAFDKTFPSPARSDRPLQTPKAFVDQIKTDVRGPRLPPFLLCNFLC